MNFEDTFIGRPNTIKVYTSLYKKHIAPYVKDLDFNDWKEQNLTDLLRVWEKSGLSWRTRQSLIRLFARYVEFKQGPKISTKRLIGHLEREEQQTEVLVLNPEQTELIMNTCKRLKPKFYPILLLGLHAGLRRGEIFGLRCGDIDMLNNRIRVAHSYDGPTKNGRTRYVPMSAELSNTLFSARNLLMRPLDQRVFEIQDPNPTLRRLCSIINGPTLRFHDLRHTFATLGLEKGISPRQMAAWLGHSSVHTTLSLYWNLTKDVEDINTFLPSTKEEK